MASPPTDSRRTTLNRFDTVRASRRLGPTLRLSIRRRMLTSTPTTRIAAKSASTAMLAPAQINSNTPSPPRSPTQSPHRRRPQARRGARLGRGLSIPPAGQPPPPRPGEARSARSERSRGLPAQARRVLPNRRSTSTRGSRSATVLVVAPVRSRAPSWRALGLAAMPCRPSYKRPNPPVTPSGGTVGATPETRPADEFPFGRPSTFHRSRCKGAMTMKLIASMMLTLDGVYQGPGGPDEDRRGGFDRGGWTAPYADEEGWHFLTSLFERADALLLGRKTWEIFEGVLAAPRRGRPGLPRHQRPAQVRAVDHAQGPDLAEHPRHRWRRRGGGARAQGEARARAPGPWQRRPAPVAARARPRRRAQPADLPRRGRRGASALPGAVARRTTWRWSSHGTTPTGVMLQTYRPAGRRHSGRRGVRSVSAHDTNEGGSR